MKALLLTLTLISMNSFALTADAMKSLIQSEVTAKEFRACAKMNQEVQNAQLCEELLAELVAELSPVSINEIPSTVTGLLAKKVVRKCKTWKGCQYSSGGGEYVYKKEYHSTYELNSDEYLVVYSGVGGEWARQTGDYLFYVVNGNGELVNWSKITVWSENNRF